MNVFISHDVYYVLVNVIFLSLNVMNMKIKKVKNQYVLLVSVLIHMIRGKSLEVSKISQWFTYK